MLLRVDHVQCHVTPPQYSDHLAPFLSVWPYKITWVGYPPLCHPGLPMPKSDIKGEIKKVDRKKFIVKCARRYATTEIASSSGN